MVMEDTEKDSAIAAESLALLQNSLFRNIWNEL